MDRSRTQRSFLLTAWQEIPDDKESQSVWRFSMEDARGINRRRVFTTLEEVIRYVKEKLDVREELEDETVHAEETNQR